MDTREAVAMELARQHYEASHKEIQTLWENLGKPYHEKFRSRADAILAIFAEERAALMAVAEKNEDYEEAIERDRDKWRKACEKAEAREAVLMKALQDTADTRDALQAREAALVAALRDVLPMATVYVHDEGTKEDLAAIERAEQALASAPAASSDRQKVADVLGVPLDRIHRLDLQDGKLVEVPDAVAAIRADAWVSVKERMPEEYGEYLVWISMDDGAHYSTAHWSPGWSTPCVTHWLPLPPAPEVKA